MKYIKSSLMILAATLMSGGCQQSTSESFEKALALAKAKMTDSNNNVAQGNIEAARSAQPDNSAELNRLKQVLQQTQQQLSQSNSALLAAKNQLKNVAPVAVQPQAALLQKEQDSLNRERDTTAATTRHVTLLKQRLAEQDVQLGKLYDALMQTEEGCREIAEQLSAEALPS